IDLDEWQDIYIVNGYVNENTQPARESNQFFRNDKGKTFIDETDQVGMTMFAETDAYTYVDFDNDGDLDIAAVESLGPVWINVNNGTENNGISIELRDDYGNSFGVGSSVTVSYGDKGSKQQIREVQASGGFLSHDAPQVHFGLGKAASISKIRIDWSTGETTELNGNFAAGKRYRINRNGL
ncbi:MAG: ASPIC/UnbV domain-containing protein, partial [Gammaproteobacteria bacterium]